MEWEIMGGKAKILYSQRDSEHLKKAKMINKCPKMDTRNDKLNIKYSIIF